MIKYGTTQESTEEDGLCKVAAEPCKPCCAKKMAHVKELRGSGIEFTCNCGNRLVLEQS